MRIIAISDTHSFHRRIKFPEYQEGDVLVHAGDLTWFNQNSEATILDVGAWLTDLPYKDIIIIAGNHDICLDDDADTYEPLLKKHEKIRKTYLTSE